MARKKKEEIIEAEVIQNEEGAAETATEKTQFDYMMDVLNDARSNNEESFIWEGIEIKAKKFLNVYEMKVMFDGIFERCFSSTDQTYQPEYRDFAERACTVAVYSDVTLPESVDDQYDLMYKTDLYYAVIEHIDPMQRGALLDAIDEKIKETIDYRANQVVKTAEDTMNYVSNLLDGFKEMFDGIDPNELSGMIKAISENGIDEKAIVDAVIDKNNKAK